MTIDWQFDIHEWRWPFWNVTEEKIDNMILVDHWFGFGPFQFRTTHAEEIVVSEPIERGEPSICPRCWNRFYDIVGDRYCCEWCRKMGEIE